jgi:hypothetical protein
VDTALAYIPNNLAPNHKQRQKWITISSGLGRAIEALDPLHHSSGPKMHREFAPAQKPPVCPACGRYMKLARLVEVGLNTFECGPCCVSYTTATEESQARGKYSQPGPMNSLGVTQ